jgi:hypothetical protein
MQWGEEKVGLGEKTNPWAATARVLEKLSRLGFIGKQLYPLLCILRASRQLRGKSLDVLLTH